jgi:hypothetical protein
MNEDIDYTNLNGWSISSEMFNWILNNIEEGSTVLEFGAGKSTIELAKRYKVISIEQDIRWAHLTKDATYYVSPIIENWYDTKIVMKAVLGRHIKLVIIDGPSGTGNRKGLIKFLIYNRVLINTAVFIVDDTHRESERAIAERISVMTKRSPIYIKDSEKEFCVI